ncbi:hypothetical protein Avbf_12549 [Armadillidium vulgare]|nr:hypothetical protein Avbf_12549 [Armadillidium vulgare]
MNARTEYYIILRLLVIIKFVQSVAHISLIYYIEQLHKNCIYFILINSFLIIASTFEFIYKFLYREKVELMFSIEASILVLSTAINVPYALYFLKNVDVTFILRNGTLSFVHTDNSSEFSEDLFKRLLLLLTTVIVLQMLVMYIFKHCQTLIKVIEDECLSLISQHLRHVLKDTPKGCEDSPDRKRGIIAPPPSPDAYFFKFAHKV